MSEKNYCRLCPRECGADRETETGACGCGRTLRIARAAPHYWEEPCISGVRGSGAVFFSGCNLKCIFCQNKRLSYGYEGVDIDFLRLSEIFIELQEQGVHNINLVTPTPWSDVIKRSLDMAWEKGLWLPTVYNTGGYETPETIKSLRGYIGVYLPDFKYISPSLSERLSGAYDYPEFAKRSLYEMVEQRGEPLFDEEGIMTKGVIVRHLVLPGEIENSLSVLDYLKSEYGNSIYISIMNQYTPTAGADGELSRPLRDEEYDAVLSYARELGIKNGFIQEKGTAKESFIPEWNGLGVLKKAKIAENN